MTELYWSNVTLLNCRAHANIHIVVIRCIFNCCFHTAVSFCCLFRYWEESAQYIFTYSSKRRSSLDAVALKCCVCSSLDLPPGGLNYSLALQRHTGQTAVLQALTLGHMRSNDYSTTKIFVDNFLLSTLSIMSTNRCSPTYEYIFVFCWAQTGFLLVL